MHKPDLRILVHWTQDQWSLLEEMLDILNGDPGFEIDDLFTADEIVQAMLYLITTNWSRAEIMLRWGTDHAPDVPRLLRSRPEDESVHAHFMELFQYLRDRVCFCQVPLRLAEPVDRTDFIRLTTAYPLAHYKG